MCADGLQQPEVLPDGHRRLGAGLVTHGTSMDPAPGCGKAGPPADARTADGPPGIPLRSRLIFGARAGSGLP
ncbi:hypothetical protein GCM10010264_65740 [Streptomyces globisporus]|nr:hypothetical protein GCM10010264_65740 [Streptomyces globisporus]